MQRWYFVPNYDSVLVSDDHLAMELVGEGVKLIGQDELVREDGTRTQSSKKDRASQAFVNSFTEKYAALARVSPVFAQLGNLIDLSIAAAYIQKFDSYSQSGWDLGIFAREAEYAVETLPEPKSVETAVNVIVKGNRFGTPIGGGVNIQPLQAFDESRVRTGNGTIDDVRPKVDVRDLGDRWWWD
jgi:hypothetical protein